MFYVSLHATQDYPCAHYIVLGCTAPHYACCPFLDFTGTADERGAELGQGFNLNIPLPKGATGDDEYCVVLQQAIEQIRIYDPAYLILR